MYRLIARPFSARKAASSFRRFHVITPAIAYLLATEGGILFLCAFSRSDMARVRPTSSSPVWPTPARERSWTCGAFPPRAGARSSTATWQEALEATLAEPDPCFMCAETPWWRCHRRLIAELLAARGHEVVHLMRPGKTESHRLYAESSVRAGKLYLC